MKFVIIDNGDATTGNYGNWSDIDTTAIDNATKEELESFKSILEECFTKIHDAPVRVFTKAEFDDYTGETDETN